MRGHSLTDFRQALHERRVPLRAKFALVLLTTIAELHPYQVVLSFKLACGVERPHPRWSKSTIRYADGSWKHLGVHSKDRERISAYIDTTHSAQSHVRKVDSWHHPLDASLSISFPFDDRQRHSTVGFNRSFKMTTTAMVYPYSTSTNQARASWRERTKAGSHRFAGMHPPPGPPCRKTTGFPLGLPHSS